MMLPFPIEYVVLGGLFLIIIILALWVLGLERRLKHLARGKKGASLEDTIHALLHDNELLKKHHGALVQKNTVIEDKLAASIRGVATVRFNPFKDSGGNQSFATAFVNEHGNGVVISSLYSRERVSIFAKPVTEMESSYKLTTEERTALSRAYESFNSK